MPRELPRRKSRGRRPAAQQSTGRRGEQLAAEHLRRLGLEILARNVRTGAGEIDLVAGDGLRLVFVEVKTTRWVRSAAERPASSAAGAAADVLERLGARQRRRLRGLALEWLRARPAGWRGASELRFDAVGVAVDGRGRLLALEHLEGAW
jgi:putative endonuclease